MKKLLFLLYLLPISIFGQVYIPTHYDADHTAEHIIRGHVKMYCGETVKYVVEKKRDTRFVRDEITPDQAKKRLDKVFKMGKPEFVSRTNGGYIFTIAVLNPKDETVTVRFVTVHVDAFTQKIQEIEVLLGE